MTFTEAQKARTVAKYIGTESVTVTYIWAHKNTQKTPPSRNTFLCWHTRFLQDVNMEQMGGTGRPRVSDQNFEDLRLSFEKKSSPKYNTGRVTLEHILINDTANFT